MTASISLAMTASAAVINCGDSIGPGQTIEGAKVVFENDVLLDCGSNLDIHGPVKVDMAGHTVRCDSEGFRIRL